MRKIKHGRLAGGCSDACCLKLEGLSVHIQGEDILEDVSFHLHCGEIAALIGPNGAGKSSLFRSILGQMPYSGTITFSPAGGPAVRLSDGANAPLAAIFLSTHDFATLGQFADKVILLNRRVLKSGPPDEVLSSPEFYETFHLRVGKGGQT